MKRIFPSHAAKLFPWFLLALWTASRFIMWESNGFSHKINSVGLFFGGASFIFFSFSLLLITRWKKLEDWLGGLDQVFRYHQFLGKFGFVCLLFHTFTFALKWAPKGLGSFFLYLLPLHHRFSVNLGSYAFISMSLILSITIFKLFPYHIWKKIHQLMSVVFLVSFLHFFLSGKSLGNGLSTAILYFSALIGFSSIVYKQLLFKFLVVPIQYTVIRTEAFNETLMKITLRAKNRGISFVPGQYAFIHFEEPNFSKEAHPFTLARDESSDDLFIYVKNRGDYTKALHRSLRSGWTAFLEGPYGRLDFRSDRKQIWIAGGIGIALFLSWIHSLQLNHGKTINLFFCCHKKADLAVLKEFARLKDALGVTIHTFCSEEGKRLSSAEVVNVCPDYKERKIFMCGPKKLTYDMRKQLIGLSVKWSNIEYEDFNYF